MKQIRQSSSAKYFCQQTLLKPHFNPLLATNLIARKIGKIMNYIFLEYLILIALFNFWNIYSSARSIENRLLFQVQINRRPRFRNRAYSIILTPILADFVENWDKHLRRLWINMHIGKWVIYLFLLLNFYISSHFTRIK